MKRWKGLSLMMLLLILLGIWVSCAPYSMHRRGMLADPLHGVELYSRTLNLSPDQLGAIAKLRGDLRKEELRRRAELQTAMIDLRDLTHRPPKDLDEAKIIQKIDEIGALETGMRREAARAGFSLRKILTEDQYDRFAEILSGVPDDY